MTTLSLMPWLQATSAASTITVASEIAEVVIAVAMLVLVVLVAALVLRLNRVVSELQRAAHQNFGPVSDRARTISDNVEYITQSVRTDVDSLNQSIRGLSERLQLASDRMEERIEDFNALMTVVQGEAEELFLDTASTVRGVREGARAIAESTARPSPERFDEAMPDGGEEAPEGVVGEAATGDSVEDDA